MYTIYATFPDGLKATCQVSDSETMARLVAEMETGTVYIVLFNGRPLWI